MHPTARLAALSCRVTRARKPSGYKWRSGGGCRVVERAQVITGACQAARAFAFAGLRARHPEASERKLIALYVELTAGPELARLAYPGILEPTDTQQS